MVSIDQNDDHQGKVRKVSVYNYRHSILCPFPSEMLKTTLVAWSGAIALSIWLSQLLYQQSFLSKTQLPSAISILSFQYISKQLKLVSEKVLFVFSGEMRMIARN